MRLAVLAMRNLPAVRRPFLASLLLVIALTPAGWAQSPTSQPRVQASNMRYLGSFRLPSSDGSGASTGSLNYGGTALGLTGNGGLLLGGHDWYQRLCEVSIPTIGGTASIRQRCVDVAENRLSQIDSDTVKLGGTLVYNGRLIVSAFSYYDADGGATRSHFASGTTLATSGDVTGPVQVGTAGAGFVAAYMGVVPQEWRPLLGGPALTGSCCLSIISRTSSGPAISVFDPDKVGRVTPVPATQLLGYPLNHPVANASTANNLFTHADMMGGVAFPAGTRSVLFIGRHGTGQPCYGEADACNDPAQTYKGGHAYPYVHQVWAYDANDLLAVKNGTKKSWELRPYATWRLTEMNNSGSATIAGATYDPSTRRLYVTERYGEAPRVHVYEITAGTSQPPAPPIEVCGDGIDNDLDGQIDEGCTVSGPGPPPTPEVCGDGIDNDRDGQIDEGCAPPAALEICGDGVDNDGDREIDEGCPGAPQRLVGDVRGSQITLSWLAPISGTVPTQYSVEAGLAPGQAAYAFSTGTQTGTRVQNVGVGKYYIRVHSLNSAGRSVASNELVLSVGCSGAPNPLTNLLTKVRGALVTLTWTDPDGCTDTAYRVTLAGSPGGANVAEVSTGLNTVSGVAGPGTYYARATTISSRGVSAPSEEVKIVVTGGTCTPPQFATRLQFQVTGSRVQFAWNPANVAEALAADSVAPLFYVLEAGTAPGATNVLRASLGRTTFVSGFAPPGTYYVRMRPTDICGLGRPSNEVMVQVP